MELVNNNNNNTFLIFEFVKTLWRLIENFTKKIFVVDFVSHVIRGGGGGGGL